LLGHQLAPASETNHVVVSFELCDTCSHCQLI
jgi:hypothetical protein